MHWLVISSIIFSTVIVMVVAFLGYHHLAKNNSEQIIQLTCSDKMKEIDEKLKSVEQSVHTIYRFAMDQLEEINMNWQDEKMVCDYIGRVRELMETSVDYTDGAVTVYYRLNPQIQEKISGIWLVQNEEKEFVQKEMTDLSLYGEDEIEYVGWYYLPIENGQETWLNPYNNKNMEMEIITFAIPLIQEDTVIGVIGMDVATELLYESTKSVSAYNTGYAFLMDNEGNFIYHPEMTDTTISEAFNEEHRYLYEKSLLAAESNKAEKYRWNNVDKKLCTQRLCNGMLFSVCAKEQEIKQPQNDMIVRSIWIIIVIVSIFVCITADITKSIVKLIYKDVMTGVGNKTAYRESVDYLERKIVKGEKVDFAVAVMDINNLKMVNDTYGHQTGDKLILSAADILKKLWGSGITYRVGGDEFVVIFQNVNEEDMSKEVASFEHEVAEFRQKNEDSSISLQVAIGYAVYDAQKDKEYKDVFRRADNAMYEDKKQKKSSNP